MDVIPPNGVVVAGFGIALVRGELQVRADSVSIPAFTKWEMTVSFFADHVAVNISKQAIGKLVLMVILRACGDETIVKVNNSGGSCSVNLATIQNRWIRARGAITIPPWKLLLFQHNDQIHNGREIRDFRRTRSEHINQCNPADTTIATMNPIPRTCRDAVINAANTRLTATISTESGATLSSS